MSLLYFVPQALLQWYTSFPVHFSIVINKNIIMVYVVTKDVYVLIIEF